LGVDAAIKAKVTVTGAFDDACASYFGNVVVTDNTSRKILKTFNIKENEYQVLIHVPKEKKIHKEALSGNYWTAMTLNGLVHSAVLSYNPEIELEALKNGAVAAGLSGKGPAVAAVVPAAKVEDVLDAWQSYEGDIIKTEINREKAHILR